MLNLWTRHRRLEATRDQRTLTYSNSSPSWRLHSVYGTARELQILPCPPQLPYKAQYYCSTANYHVNGCREYLA